MLNLSDSDSDSDSDILASPDFCAGAIFCCFWYIIALVIIAALFFLTYFSLGVNFINNLKNFSNLLFGNVFFLFLDLILCVSFVAVGIKFALEASKKDLCYSPVCEHNLPQYSASSQISLY